MALVTLTPSDYAGLLGSLDDNSWVAVCFCAGWCRSCREFQPELEQFTLSFPQGRFIWVDIEGHDDMLGELDVDKFPTLLLQRGNMVAFYSCIHPDIMQTKRILQSVLDESPEALQRQAQSNEERRMWQKDCNFRVMLQNGMDAAP